MTVKLKQGLADLSTDVKPVDLRDRVLRGSHRRTVRRRAAGSAALVLAVAGVVASFTLVRPAGDLNPPAATPSVVATPSAVRPSTEPSAIDVANATFAVPAFPAGGCPGGDRTFANRVAEIGQINDQQLSLILGEQVVKGRLEGQLGEVTLVPIYCRNYTQFGQVLALKQDPVSGKFSTVGFVLVSPDHLTFEIDEAAGAIRLDGSTILVDLISPGIPDGGHGILDKQTRGYSFDAGSFRQVSGPVSFASPPADPTRTDFRNTTMEIRTPGASGYLRTRDGTGEVMLGQHRWAVTVKSSAFMPGTRTAVVSFELDSPQLGKRYVINVYEFVLPVPTDHMFVGLASGEDGIVAIEKVELTSTQAKVTVRTATGTEVRTYRQSTSGTVKWDRVS